jgi:molybdopterin converting factor small subunit
MYNFIYNKGNNVVNKEVKDMKVNLKCFSSLVDPETCDFRDSTEYELNDGQTVEALVERAGIDKDSVKIAFLNNKTVDMDTVLSDGDRVGLAPSVGGM